MSTTQLARTGQNQGAVQARKGETLEALFAKRGQELAQVAAEGLSVQRLYRTMLMCMSKNPDLAKCSPESLYRAMQDAAEVGLEPGGALGLAYLIPYAGNCEYQIGYRGYIELARRSGIVNHVHPVAVFDDDVFEYEMGLQPILKHKPGSGKHTPDKLTHVYAIAHFAGMPPQFDVMTRAECEAIRARSKTRPGTGPWATDFVEMCKKTVLRRICKILPRSIAVKSGVTVAADGRIHRAEPVRIGGSGPMMIEEPADYSDDEFEPAAPSTPPARSTSPRRPTEAELKDRQKAEEDRLCTALAVEAVRIWSMDEYVLTPELASRILDKPVTDVAADWEVWGVRDFVRILFYALNKGATIPLTEEIPNPADILAEAQSFGNKDE